MNVWGASFCSVQGLNESGAVGQDASHGKRTVPFLPLTSVAMLGSLPFGREDHFIETPNSHFFLPVLRE